MPASKLSSITFRRLLPKLKLNYFLDAEIKIKLNFNVAIWSNFDIHWLISDKFRELKLKLRLKLEHVTQRMSVSFSVNGVLEKLISASSKIIASYGDNKR